MLVRTLFELGYCVKIVSVCGGDSGDRSWGIRGIDNISRGTNFRFPVGRKPIRSPGLETIPGLPGENPIRFPGLKPHLVTHWLKNHSGSPGLESIRSRGEPIRSSRVETPFGRPLVETHSGSPGLETQSGSGEPIRSSRVETPFGHPLVENPFRFPGG